MTTLAQNSGDNDLVLDGHDLKTVSGVDAYAVIIEQCIRTLSGEIQLDDSLGIPYVETIFSSVSKVSSWKMNVRDRIKKLSFVTSINKFDCTISGDTLSYSLTISTDLGDTSVSSSVGL